MTIDGNECPYTEATVTVAVAEVITLVKTVGTTAGECATTTSLSVVSGTTVYYCYTVTNDTQSTLVTHSLSDDVLGDLLVGRSRGPPAGREREHGRARVGGLGCSHRHHDQHRARGRPPTNRVSRSRPRPAPR